MRRVLSLLLVALLGLAGLAAIAVGVAQRTVWLPDDEVTATATLPSGVPLAVTEPGVLEMRDGPVSVEVTSPSADAPALLAVGRENDVLAWVGEAAHARVGGLVDEHQLEVTTVDGETPVPDPAGSDLWIQEEVGTGGATFVYDPPEGSWLVLAAGTGEGAAPNQLEITWPREVTTPWSVPLIVTGSLLLLAALGLLVLLWSRGELGARDRRRQR